VRLSTIGNTSQLPLDCQNNLAQAIDGTKGNTGLNLLIALNYSGRWEIIKAVKELAKKVKAGIIEPHTIDEAMFSQLIETRNIPDPELLIRTSGEMRISNFLLWQIAYTELYVTPKLWPDFRKEDLYEAICEYQKRERRFGKVLTPIA
jgi:undecaprenyl diphosphate synthase